MNSDIYLAVVDLILPSLIAVAGAGKRSSYLTVDDTRPEEPSFTLDLFAIKYLSKTKKNDAAFRAAITNSITLFCRDAIHTIRYQEKDGLLAVYLRKGQAYLSNPMNIDARTVHKALVLGSKVYYASNFEKRYFESATPDSLATSASS